MSIQWNKIWRQPWSAHNGLLIALEGCCFLLAGAWAAAQNNESLGGSNRISFSVLQSTVVPQGHSIQSFRVEGVVCAVVPERKMAVLQDETAGVLLELPGMPNAVQIGDCLEITGTHCSLVRNRYGMRLGSPLSVDNDGLHAAIVKSGSTFLEKGMQPIRLAWFNSGEPSALSLEYEGPGFQLQKVPDSLLWHGVESGTDAVNYERGLQFASYLGTNWYRLPDFAPLKPVKEGIATNFLLAYRAGENDTALVFRGFLEVPADGIYRFHLQSDDGAELLVGKEGVGCQVARLERGATPVVSSFAAADLKHARWTELEGEVSFSSPDQSGLQLELLHGGNSVQVTIVEGRGLDPANLLHQRVRIRGISEGWRPTEPRSAWVIVPGAAQVEFLNRDLDVKGAELTTAAEVRRLKAEEANKPCHASLRGVITWRSPVAVVLQDATGGVFIHLRSDDPADQPVVGDLWQIEGTTDRGDWSPVVWARQAAFLGHGPLPEPVHPTWDQLMNGSLDAQYVEIRGVICSATADEMTILTRGGKLRILSNDERPLPSVSVPGIDPTNYIDSLVRIRGCLTAEIDWNTKRTKAGEIFLSPATINVEEPRPIDPFAPPTRRISDLLLFDAALNALQRTKVSGQIIHIRRGECFLQDGQTGLRLLAGDVPGLRTGDLVEAVGWPRFGGPSPVLQQARVRKIGRAPLPTPSQIPANALLDRDRDSTLARVEATLVSEMIHENERVLELQSATHRFAAILKSDPRTWQPLLVGSRLGLTGIYACGSEYPADGTLEPFELLLNNAAGITVLQQPPWWTLRRAIAVAAALAGALGIAFIWITLLRRKVEHRTAQLQKEIEARQTVEQHRLMEQERIRVARDLHDELGTGLTEVGILSTLAKNPAIGPEEKEQYLQQLTDSARSLVTGLDEIVWAINPQYDSIGSLATYYSLFAQRFLNLAGIACRLSVPPSLPEHSLDSKVRHGVFLAFKEALNNIVRHSGATEVELKIQHTDGQLAVSLRDNGRGLASEKEVPGTDGLAGMRRRLHDLGGDCHIAGSAGQGTTVEFHISLNGRNGKSHD